VPHTETLLFGVDFFARLFERVFCPHPSLTALFLKYPMSAINPANNSSNTHSHSWLTNQVPDITPSHAHSSASIVTLIASIIVLRHVIQIRGASRRQSYTLCNPGSPCTLRFIQILLSVHSTFPIPTCKYPFIDRYHLYNTVHYIKKIIMLLCTTCPWDPYTHLSAFNPVCLLTAFGVSGCPYIGL
jgi:hypothetical protein